MYRVLRLFSALLIASFVASAHAADAVSQAPKWQQLNSAQQSMLAPLSDRWDGLTELQRKRILSSAKRYPKMTEAKKKRFSARLLEWSSLTPDQRNLARDRFREFQNLPRHEREAIISRWRQQQAIAKKQQLEQEQSSQAAPEVEPPAPSSDPVANDLPNEQPAPLAAGRIR